MSDAAPSNLESYIAAQPSQVGGLQDLPDGVTIEDAPAVALPEGSALPLTVPTAAVAPASVGSDASAAPAAPVPDPNAFAALQAQLQQQAAVNAQLQQQAQQQAAWIRQSHYDRLQADEDEFARSIEHYPAETRERLLLERENQQYQQLLGWFNADRQQTQLREQQLQRQSQAAEQLAAKRIIAWLELRRAGHDPSDPVKFDIMMRADHPETMKAWARSLGSSQPSSSVIAGGARAHATGAPSVKPGSGNLAAYIAAHQYEIAAAE